VAKGDPYMAPSKSVEHGTPQELADALAALWARGSFDLDVAASSELHVCPRYFTVRDDGLQQPWDGRCYCNPPYGKGERLWVRKGRQEVLDGRAELVVFLLPAKTGKPWWQLLVAGEDQDTPGVYRLRYPVEAVRFLSGRVQYIGNEHPAAFPSVAILMRDYLGCGWGASDPKNQGGRSPSQLFLNFFHGPSCKVSKETL
jgi:phage N-6-adenine-methyltransferase